jgi:cobaltochelatase CobT
VFKSWFRRKSSDQPAWQFPAQPAPRPAAQAVPQVPDPPAPQSSSGQPQAAPPYRVFTREFDVTVRAERLDEILEPLPPDDQTKMADAESAFLAAALGWRTRFGEEALAAKARIANAIGAAAGRQTVVSLLVDHSGSMRKKDNILLAAAATDIACDFLLGLGVSVEILGFTTRSWKGGISRERWRSAGGPRNPGRLCDLLHIIYREVGDLRPASLLPMLRPDVLKENIDGEAVEWAAARLRARPEQNKILIVISDGAPVDDSTLAANDAGILDGHLRDVIGRLRDAADVRIGAVGIEFDVGRYYGTSRTVSTAEQLARALIDLIEQLMKLRSRARLLREIPRCQSGPKARAFLPPIAGRQRS